MEPNKPLKCYSYHKDKVYQLSDGKWCSSAYVCNHRGSPNVLTVKPGSGGGGGGGSSGGKDETRLLSFLSSFPFSSFFPFLSSLSLSIPSLPSFSPLFLSFITSYFFLLSSFFFYFLLSLFFSIPEYQ
jgi:hypothetical protein